MISGRLHSEEYSQIGSAPTSTSNFDDTQQGNPEHKNLEDLNANEDRMG